MRTSSTPPLVALAVTVLFGFGCAPLTPEHLSSDEGDKAGRASTGDTTEYNPERILSDKAFVETDPFVELEAQNPNQGFHDRVRALASLVSADPDREFLRNEVGFAEVIDNVSTHVEINPLLLLALAETEQQMSGKGTAWIREFMDHCSCGGIRGECGSECVAVRLRDAFDLALEGDEDAPNITIPFGRENGRLLAQNRATFAFFAEGMTARALARLWTVFRELSEDARYAEGLEFPFNEGWIGGTCESRDDCYFRGAECRAGTCTMPCPADRTCPDREGPGWALSFCATADGEGYCMARCADNLAEGGCGNGLSCVETPRHGSASPIRDVCHFSPGDVPGLGDNDGEADTSYIANGDDEDADDPPIDPEPGSDSVPATDPEPGTLPTEFDPDRLMDDAVFEHSASMGATFSERVDRVQAMLRQTPWGTASPLADVTWDGQAFAYHLVRTTDEARLNPLLFLTLAQQQQSALGWPSSESSLQNYLLGCDCTGTGAEECDGYARAIGYEAQLACAARTLRHNFDHARMNEPTTNGLLIGQTYTDGNGAQFTPRNAATTALYTYTPFVSSNELFFDLWLRIAAAASYTGP